MAYQRFQRDLVKVYEPLRSLRTADLPLGMQILESESLHVCPGTADPNDDYEGLI